jgi:hypothetical protein
MPGKDTRSCKIDGTRPRKHNLPGHPAAPDYQDPGLPLRLFGMSGYRHGRRSATGNMARIRAEFACCSLRARSRRDWKRNLAQSAGSNLKSAFIRDGNDAVLKRSLVARADVARAVVLLAGLS